MDGFLCKRWTPKSLEIFQHEFNEKNHWLFRLIMGIILASCIMGDYFINHETWGFKQLGMKWCNNQSLKKTNWNLAGGEPETWRNHLQPRRGFPHRELESAREGIDSVLVIGESCQVNLVRNSTLSTLDFWRCIEIFRMWSLLEKMGGLQ